ncbi:MAG: Abi-alpha family protein [Bryobacteraceae bacterium]|jgi:hypothetical protein
MQDQNLELVKAGSEGLSKGILDSLLAPFHALTMKFCGELGEALGSYGTLLRMKIGLKVMKRAEEMLVNAGIEPRSMPRKIFVPLLEDASLEDDRGLQERWAALLANAATDSCILPSFPDILRQLSCRDAVFLNAILDNVVAMMEHHYGAVRMAARIVGEIAFKGRDEMLYIFSEAGLTRNDARLLTTVHPDDIPGEDDDHAKFRISLDTLLRLRLVQVTQRFEVDGRHMKIDGTGLQSRGEDYYSMTALGHEFVMACRPPSSGGA